MMGQTSPPPAPPSRRAKNGQTSHALHWVLPVSHREDLLTARVASPDDGDNCNARSRGSPGAVERLFSNGRPLADATLPSLNSQAESEGI